MFTISSQFVLDIFTRCVTLVGPQGKSTTNANDDYRKKVVELGDDKIQLLNSTGTTLHGILQQARRMLLTH